MALAGVLLAQATLTVSAEVRVQDIARLQGQRTNKLMGYGLVVGLNGTGDGGKSANAMRALMALHRRYEQPVLDVAELRANDTVALVAVEVTIPEHGAREGQTLDVVVSALGNAKSLAGGQLLTTPLQDATLTVLDILAFAGGGVALPDSENQRRGIIRRGATLEQDFYYSFIDGEYITLVLPDEQAGFPLARMVARAINHELSSPAEGGAGERGEMGLLVVESAPAEALGPKNVRVRIPRFELARPANFISRVLQTPLFMLPEQPARVVINRTTKNISFTGTVTISPTVLQIPGLGTVSVGGAGGQSGGAGVVGLDTAQAGGVEFQELLATLSKIKLTQQQMVEAVEHLHQTGTLHAQLVYTE
ncbi:MAG: flagellar basal body P-ring protein FlgI [Planctomycetes bacterium]|nr:flagellar basal body P-ring protein FlgI [Planctomycetota bacterium]